MQRVARLGDGVESVRLWVRQRDVADGLAGPDAVRVVELEARNRALEQELRETRRTNEILKKAAAYFASLGGARPPTEVIVGFIDAHRDEWVEPICRVLQVAPRTYYTAKSGALSARAVRDAVLVRC